VTAELLAQVPDEAKALRRSPLADHPLLRAGGVASEVRFSELPFLSQVDLRVDPAGAPAQRIAERLAVALPTRPGTVASAGERSVLWLGPDEWLVLGPDGDTAALVQLLQESLGADPGSVVDVSANRTVIEIAGAAARDLLEKGTAIDLHPRSFSTGQCAQTLLSRAQVVLWQVSETPTYRLLVRPSFAQYVADWLVDGALEYLDVGQP
jgi:sarcosine oxidase subunit gamma